MGVENVEIKIRIGGENKASDAISRVNRDLKGLSKAQKKALNVNIVQKMKRSYMDLSMAVKDVAQVAGKVFDEIERTGAAADRFRILATSVEGFADVLKDAKERTSGLMPEAELTKGIALFQAFGLPLEHFGASAEQALKTSKRLGTDGATAFENLATAVARGSFKILDNLGIQADMTKVLAHHTKVTGEATEAMSAEQKTAALLAYSLNELSVLNDVVELTDSATYQFERLKVQMGEVYDATVNSLGPGLSEMAAQLSYVLSGGETDLRRETIESLSEQKRLEQDLSLIRGEDAEKARELLSVFSEIQKLEKDIAAEKKSAYMDAGPSQAIPMQARLNVLLERAHFLNGELSIAAKTQADETARADEILRRKNLRSERFDRKTTLSNMARVDAIKHEISAVRGLNKYEVARAKLKAKVLKLQGEMVKMTAAEQLAASGTLVNSWEELKTLEEKIKRLGRGGSSRQKLTERDRLSLDEKKTALALEESLFINRNRMGELELKRERALMEMQAAREKTRAETEALDAGKLGKMTGEKKDAEIERLGVELQLLEIKHNLKLEEIDAEEKLLAIKEKDKSVELMRSKMAVMSDAADMAAKSENAVLSAMGKTLKAIDQNMDALHGTTDEAISAGGKIAAAAIDNEAAKAGVLAITELAAGFAALATPGMQGNAAMHFVAAGLYGSIAGVSAMTAGAGGASTTKGGHNSPIVKDNIESGGATVININAPVVGGTPAEVGATLGGFSRASERTGMGGAV
tara:strand:+ start:8131 stop:10392 length:2262 start_codon:yes stop_codon:yes gene_type:complete